MQFKTITFLPLLAAVAIALTSGAKAEDLCQPMTGEAKSKDEIKSMLEAQGFQVKKLGEEDGCVEMKGFDKDQKRVEVYVHPVSGEIVKIKS
jgi:hypothetical protein